MQKLVVPGTPEKKLSQSGSDSSASGANLQLCETPSKQGSEEQSKTEPDSLFQEFLAYLDRPKDTEDGMLNPVLLGYWCNLFKSLVITHPQEVFLHVYEHQEIIDKMLDHLYSP